MSSLPQEIRERLTALADGEGDVGQTARWALEVMEADDPVWRHEAVWRVLDKLGGADTMAAPGQYLYGRDDFRTWLREFTDEYDALDADADEPSDTG